MTEPKIPIDFDAPPKRTLVEATAIAAGVAAVVLVLFILPAEYGVDPTRFGEAIGIKGMAAGAGVEAAPSQAHVIENQPFVTDSAELTLLPGESLEYKYQLAAGSGLLYTWSSSGPVYFDLHGEGPNGSFASQQTGDASSGDGLLSAPFEGTHGWYWRNDGFVAVTINLNAAGHFETVGVV